mgnify:CR=1 FL=1
MIGWINFTVLILAAALFVYFYLKSALPGALEKKIGALAYGECQKYRSIASLLMMVVGIDYVFYFLYPIPLPIPQTFPWSWWVSAAISGVVALGAAYLWWGEMNDAPANHHSPFPSELPFWCAIAFLLHSPFLALFSLIWVPVFLLGAWLENQDLTARHHQETGNYTKKNGGPLMAN